MNANTLSMRKINQLFMGTVLGLALLTAGCAGNRYERSTGESIDDRATSMRVKSALNDDTVYKYPHVEVSTFKGSVQLSGFVDTGEQKARAADIAENIQGVRELKNNISVKP